MELFNQINTSVDAEMEDIDQITTMADLLGMLTVNEMYDVVARWLEKDNEWTANWHGGPPLPVTDEECAKIINAIRPTIKKYQSV